MQRSIPQLLRQASRLIAVSAATQAQPFGIDDKAEAVGQVATNRDIYRVYATPGKAFEDITNSGAANGFWKAVKSSAWDRAAKILNREGNRLKSTVIGDFDGGSQHRQLRNSQGRISPNQRAVMVVKNPSALKTYVTSEMAKVGQGKGGWASCARALGGVRGLPRWITKHNSPASVSENYTSQNMRISMINQVPYASSLMTPGQKAEAVQIAMDRLLKSMQIASSGRGRTIPSIDA